MARVTVRRVPGKTPAETHFNANSLVKDPAKTATVKPTTAGQDSATNMDTTDESQAEPTSPEEAEEMEVEVGKKDAPPGPKRPCMKDELRQFRPSYPHRWGDTWTDDKWQEQEKRSRTRKVAKPFEFPEPDPPSTVKNPFESTRIH